MFTRCTSFFMRLTSPLRRAKLLRSPTISGSSSYRVTQCEETIIHSIRHSLLSVSFGNINSEYKLAISQSIVVRESIALLCDFQYTILDQAIEHSGKMLLRLDDGRVCLEDLALRTNIEVKGTTTKVPNRIWSGYRSIRVFRTLVAFPA